MIVLQGDSFYSPHDLMDYMECKYLAHQKIKGAQDLQSEEDELTKLLSAKGLEYEADCVDRLRQSSGGVVDIPKDLPLQEQIRITREVMADGAPVIYQPVLIGERWHGHCDLLLRVDKPSHLGEFSYEVHDIKLSRAPKPSFIIQISIYSRLLTLIQQAAPKHMHLVLGSGDRHSFRFADFGHYCARLCDALELFWANPASCPYPEAVERCELCKLKASCAEKRASDDHLSLVANMHRSQIKKLNNVRIFTVRELADLPDSFRVPKMAPETLGRLRSQAWLQVKGKKEAKPCIEMIPQEEGRGFYRFPKPSVGDIFFDIEGDPLYADGLEYLFGFCLGDTNEQFYQCFWAHNHEEEERSLVDLMLFLFKHFKKHTQACIYHYGSYEVNALKRLSSRYGRCEAILDDFLRRLRFVDLYRIVCETVRTSQPGYSLKDMEVFYMDKRSDSVKTAGESIIEYEHWRQSGQGELLEQIRAYNETDCVSMIHLREWLLSMKTQGIPWRDHVTIEDAREAEWSEFDELRNEYEKNLMAGMEDEEWRVRRLIADLLEFHHREAKPIWWEMFDRQGRSEEELIDDIECLGGLRLAHSGPSTYAFPEQECKLTVGSDCLCASTLERAGKIQEIDFDKKLVTLRRSARSGPLPPEFSLIPTGPIKTEVLRNALYRFADAIIDGEKRYGAILDLLRRDSPRLKHRASGAPLVSEGSASTDEICGAVSSMDETYLFIQGPPGSGKTYAASRVIVDLIGSGKRVGVMSNSHKAINNLLKKVEKRAGERCMTFKGIKKATGGQEDSFLHGQIIRDVTDNNLVDPTADLIAGTVWLFSRPELDQVIDYLFIDEAGQVAMANVVAAGLSAHNIVLVGDQMQLGQPLQGVHPRESGQSVLEYLLQDQATVSPDRGVFLGTTWRMHESICSFISRAVYGGRLHAAEDNRHQVLLLNSNAHPALSPAGLRFIEVSHEGCSQKSEQEGKIITEIYTSLMAQCFQDKKKLLSPMRPENVLIVAPYNMQVNYLRCTLPEGVRVGTIDKFQGQEAEIAVISMTTSSEEELPRQIGFLYSRNRLNVAISRAKVLAVIVASPKLLEIKCRTIEEMELVNTLCWAREYALGLSI